MKKLVLSAVLGMFCYCTNNAMDEKEEELQIEIKGMDDVFSFMILAQIGIFKARETIEAEGKNIYATIKDENKKVTKNNLLNFIKKQFKAKSPEEFKEGINYLEQYFHLEKINENDECTKDNLTEMFWDAQEMGEKINEAKEGITTYLVKIAESENDIRECFKAYYDFKKAEKTQTEKEVKKEEIIKEMVNECCERDEKKDPHTDFLANLRDLCDNNEEFKDQKDAILEAIQRRITLDKEITKDALKDFIKQKIEPLYEKDKDTITVNDDKPKDKKKQEGGCPCCNDCCGNE